jgi:hypothetical protein
MKKKKRKLLKELQRIANSTAFTLRNYLPTIESRFAPSTEVSGELDDCREALEDVLCKLRKKKKQ